MVSYAPAMRAPPDPTSVSIGRPGSYYDQTSDYPHVLLPAGRYIFTIPWSVSVVTGPPQAVGKGTGVTGTGTEIAPVVPVNVEADRCYVIAPVTVGNGTRIAAAEYWPVDRPDLSQYCPKSRNSVPGTAVVGEFRGTGALVAQEDTLPSESGSGESSGTSRPPAPLVQDTVEELNVNAWSAQCGQIQLPYGAKTRLGCHLILHAMEDKAVQWRFIVHAGDANLPQGYIAGNLLQIDDLPVTTATPRAMLFFGDRVHENVAFPDMEHRAVRPLLMKRLQEKNRFTLLPPAGNPATRGEDWGSYFARCETRLMMWIEVNEGFFQYRIPFDLTGFDTILDFIKSHGVNISFDGSPVSGQCTG